MTERFDFAVSDIFADAENRTISGIAVPLDQTARRNGKNWRFLSDSVKLADRTPALLYHDVTKPIGRVVDGEWTNRGFEITCKISETAAGNEALALAADGVLGFSMGIDDVVGKVDKDEYHVSSALAGEISLTPVPAFSGATVESVKMNKEDNMSEHETAASEVTAVNVDAEKLGQAIAAAMPKPQPIPTLSVKEPAPYRFDGVKAPHSLMADMKAAYMDHNHDANVRIEKFLAERFVVAADAAELNPTRNVPAMYVDQRQAPRPLSQVVNTATLADITPFQFPKYESSGNLVNPHVEGVEPTLATFSLTSQTVTPGALSGKAEITRELVDQSSPQIDALIWQQMLRSAADAAEARLATMLNGVTTTAIALNGTDAALFDDLDNELLALPDSSIFSGMAASPTLFAALATGRDSTGRKLAANINPMNADGSRNGTNSLDVNGLAVVRASGLTTKSYLIDRNSVYQWLSAPRRFYWDLQVKSVYIGFWQYAAEAVTDATGVIPVTYSAS